MTEKNIKFWALFISIVWVMAAFFLNWIFTRAIEKATSQEVAAKLLELSYSFCVLCVVIVEVIIIEIVIFRAFLKVDQNNMNSISQLVSLVLGFFILLALPSVISIDPFRDYLTRQSSFGIGRRFAMLVAIGSPACTIKYFIYKSILLEKCLTH